MRWQLRRGQKILKDSLWVVSRFQLMLNHPVTSTVLIVLSGFLLSLLSLFVTDPYCRQLQKRRLAVAAANQIDLVVDELTDKVTAVTNAGHQLGNLPKMAPSQISANVKHLLRLPGAFTVEVAKREAKVQRPVARKFAEVMKKGRFDNTYRVASIDSNDATMAEHVGTERIVPIVRMVYQSGGTMISRPHPFYRNDRMRTGIATTIGSPEQTPLGLLVVTFDDLVSSHLLSSEEVTTELRELNLANIAIRKRPDYQVISTDDRHYEAEAKVAGRVFQFRVTELPAAHFHPHWVKWIAFLFCNALACGIGLTWLQSGRAELLRRNQELEREVTRRSAMEKHLQSTIDFRDHERELIAHEIHDGFVQDVIGAQMFAEAAAAHVEQESPVRKQTSLISELLGNAIEEARKTIDYLKPRVVDEAGLVEALRSSIDQDLKNYQFHTDFHCDDNLPRFPILVERMLYRIIREGISNSRQHSGSNRATVTLSVDAERITVEVVDEGAGFDEQQVRDDSFGLPGIRQRVEMLNGEMNLQTSDIGTKLVVEIPSDVEAPDIPTNESLMVNI